MNEWIKISPCLRMLKTRFEKHLQLKEMYLFLKIEQGILANKMVH